jgi:hypothetical protein
MAHQPEPEKEHETMDRQTIPRPSPLDKMFALRTPTWRTTPLSCITCGAPIRTLEDWLASECPSAAADQQEAA